MQLDSWSPSGAPDGRLYVVLTASLVAPGYTFRTVGLGVDAFEANAAPEEVAGFVLRCVERYWGKGVAVADVCLSITVGKGEVLPQAVGLLGVPCLPCLQRLLQQATLEALQTVGNGDLGRFFMRMVLLAEHLTGGWSRPQPGCCAIEAELRNIDKTILKLTQLVAMPSDFGGEQDGGDLTEADWSRLQDLLGVLEAVAEVHSTIVDGRGSVFAAVVTQITELLEYLREDIVYVPAAHVQDGDEMRLERPISEVDPHIRELCARVVAHIEEHMPRDAAWRAASGLSLLLCPSQSAQSHGVDGDETALQPLEQAYQAACLQMGESAPECSKSMDAAHPKGAPGQPWRGVLRTFKAHKMDDKLHEQYKQLSPEIQMYVSMTGAGSDRCLEQHDSLRWWAEQAAPPDTASTLSGSGGDHPLPVLSRLAAQYGALRPCSLQASLLFDTARCRFEDLQLQLPWPTVQLLLFLRLNSSVVTSLTD
mmetsp:Transcript_7971/g.20591  ORF Transcript_7971/g.20591 Transcript_7971/m.20591 type:complete len:479 (+) Transcript_7971:628-2064(+)